MSTMRQQSNAVNDQISADSNTDSEEAQIIEEYKKLNDKCDVIISKIKTRKNKKQTY